jgi:acetyltransferase
MLAPAAPTYVIHRYPAHLIDRVTLDDGRSVTLRPVLPQDQSLARSFVRQLSDESRYGRFFAGMPDLSPAMAAYLTQVDYTRHLGLIAETVADDVEVQVGEARYVIADDGAQAEFAVAVDDAWQRSGVGTALMDALERAARGAGIRRLTGDVLQVNRKAQDFMRRRGYAIEANPEDATLARATLTL